MKHIIYTLLLAMTIPGYGRDGIFRSSSEGKGQKVVVTSKALKGSTVWIDGTPDFTTANVIREKRDDGYRVIWVVKFKGERPAWVFLRVGAKTYSPRGIAGPAKLDLKGVVSSSGVGGRCKITFDVESLAEAKSAEKILRAR